jgi:release factor glutamine methyltransferase
VRLHDPRRALDGGPDGLEAYRLIADGAPALLEHDGQVAVEIGHTQRQEVERLFAQAGYRLISMHRDLAGNDRAMVFSR